MNIHQVLVTGDHVWHGPIKLFGTIETMGPDHQELGVKGWFLPLPSA